MSIHLPLSAYAEARVLMLAANHILAPKDGKPIIVPTQDMVLGTYYLTIIDRKKPVGAGKIFTGINEAIMAYNNKFLSLQAEIAVRISTDTLPPSLQADSKYTMVKTTLGRMIFNEILPQELRYYHKDNDGNLELGIVMNKKELGKLVAACYDLCGAAKTAEVIDNVKNLGYHYACVAGMTVAISDVIVPPTKKDIIRQTADSVKKVEGQYAIGLITDGERYKKVVDLWNGATDSVADAMMRNLQENQPDNPIFMMADSGARGNKQQMRQLAGMRGLMADPSGKIIDLPITANFREGLSVSDYFISSHGARKGLTDTALRTADSGYLTRRLVDVAQDVIVREADCDVTSVNLKLERALLAAETFDAIEILNDELLGRVLAADIVNSDGDIVIPHDTILDSAYLERIGTLGVDSITLRGLSLTSPNSASHSLVSETIWLGTRDYSLRLAFRHNFIHEIVGKELASPCLNLRAGKILTHEDLDMVLDSDINEIFVRNNNVRGIEVEAITEGSGIIESLADRIVGRVLAEDIFDSYGVKVASVNDEIDKNLAEKIAAVRNETTKKVKIRSVLTCKSQFGVCIKCYGADLANQSPVEVGEAVGIIAAQSIGEPGTQLTMRTFHTGGVAGGDDITQGLPRVEELFEARKPKHNAIISEVEGEVSFGKNEKNDLLQITVTPSVGSPRDYTIPFGSRVNVNPGDWIDAGTKLTEGSVNPHDILRVNGLKATQQYLVYEVQKVYKSQGVEINDKHIEVMVRQMLHKVKIDESGDSEFLPGEFVDINAFESANTKIIEAGGLPAVAKPVLLGITKASLATDSFLSAASFQETTRVLMGDFPLMTGTGTFVINGAERVIVSQLVRSPGVYYDSTVDQTGKKIFTSTVIPNRGAWIELETEPGDKIRVRIDRTRKMPVTYFLRALGFEDDNDILALFHNNHFIKDELDRDDAEYRTQARSLEEVYKHIRPNEPTTSDENALQLLNSLFFDPKRYDLASVGRFKITKKLGLKHRLLGKTLAEDIVDQSTGEIIIPEGTTVTEKDLDLIYDIDSLVAKKFVGSISSGNIADSAGNVLIKKGEIFTKDILNKICADSTLIKKIITENEIDKIFASREAEIFNLVEDEVHGGFINAIPVKIKTENGVITMLCAPNLPVKDARTICIADIVSTIGYLLDLMEGVGFTDDIDHLGNRRVRSVGELLQNQFRIGLARMERVVRDRMTTQDTDIITPQALINIKPVIAAIKEFFGSSQLSQFMDQHNPLSELTHKRRLSALGPGGLSRERAGFEVRDVHNSHYGRMCPIETPEGPNIGLIGSLSNYGRIDQFGFIETPYRRVDAANHKVTNEVKYMTADEEEVLTIAQANEPLDDNDWFVNERVTARHNQETSLVRREKVNYMDVSPKQVVSIATALIPFLENDDANRALMGANMQRQAVPLLRTQAPLVGTGMEFKAACDSGVMILSEKAGTVQYVDADKIDIFNDDGSTSHYKLQKFVRSNQGTCINQIPIVRAGEHVQKNQPVADGPATDNGELALGYNIIVAYMPWEGYNYEDAILLSENLIKQDIYTSIHIEEHQCDARDTKLGPEEVTRDIPNVSEDALTNLDSDGIVAIGSDVRPGDILVGKVTPKGETELTAEERLLRAIFGEKAREVRDTSLRVPHGESGKIVDVKIFTRENNDEMAPGINKQVRVYIAQKRKISVGDKMSGRHGNKGVVSHILRQEDMPFLPDGTPVDIVLNPLGVPSRMNIGQILETHLGFAVRKLGYEIKRRPNDFLSILPEIDSHNLENVGLHIATPVFDGAREQDIFDTIKLAGLDSSGKSTLIDGRTGEKFENPVTVGCVYMLKLHHLVDDKIHARSTGPYSLVTQQPLGGKAQFGGQRFGEMEVWALEAYGASYTLQEILTVKSDDVVGRVKAYEAIVKGNNIPEPGVPESFKVLIKELQSIALDIKVLSGDSKEIDIRDEEEEEIQAHRKQAEQAPPPAEPEPVPDDSSDDDNEDFDASFDFLNPPALDDDDDSFLPPFNSNFDDFDNLD